MLMSKEKYLGVIYVGLNPFDGKLMTSYFNIVRYSFILNVQRNSPIKKLNYGKITPIYRKFYK